jgi:hypothetical protein
MHAVVMTEAGVLELNWTWLPTWIGMNAKLKKEIEDVLKSKVVGLTNSEEDLCKIDEMVFDLVDKKATHVTGLRDYLDGLKFVTVRGL